MYPYFDALQPYSDQIKTQKKMQEQLINPLNSLDISLATDKIY